MVLYFDNVEVRGNGSSGFVPGQGIKHIGTLHTHHNGGDGASLSGPAFVGSLTSSYNNSSKNARGLYVSGGVVSIGTFAAEGNHAVGHAQGLFVNNGEVAINSGRIFNNKTYAAIVRNHSKLTMENVTIGDDDFRGEPSQGYGVITTEEARVMLKGCDLTKIAKLKLVKNGTSQFVLRHNTGIVSESAGTAMIPSGETYVDVAHGIDEQGGIQVKPENITIVPTNFLGNASKWQVQRLDITRFRIQLDADPGPENATFSWSVRTAQHF